MLRELISKQRIEMGRSYGDESRLDGLIKSLSSNSLYILDDFLSGPFNVNEAQDGVVRASDLTTASEEALKVWKDYIKVEERLILRKNLPKDESGKIGDIVSTIGFLGGGSRNNLWCVVNAVQKYIEILKVDG